MYKQEQQQRMNHFIGRNKEVDTFIHWLTDTNAPWILYIHDAAEETDKKGGVGKTWLLRRCAEIARQKYQDIAVVTADFFNIGDRDRLFLAEKILAALSDLYPNWQAYAFLEAASQIRQQGTLLPPMSDETPESSIREAATIALASDLQRLDLSLAEHNKTLLVFLDTYEMIEDNPIIAVLRRSQTFPDNYFYPSMRVVIAGRNKLDWQHPNWQGREREVQVLTLAPFDLKEMREYVEIESTYDIPPDSDTFRALHDRTEGRPIIIGLAIDVLNKRIATVSDMLSVSKPQFEQYLVPQINKLENPLNWVILFMAHVYHRFNITLLEWILQSVPLNEPVQAISRDELVKLLPELSFVRRPDIGDDFVLHDEMRRLVTRYCWAGLDPDRRFRKDISRNVINYYERELAATSNEQQRQGYIVEILYHRLYVDLDDGLKYFYTNFSQALDFLKTSLARLLWQETQKFLPSMSLAQHNELQLTEVRLYYAEGNPHTALELLQQIPQEADPQWYAENKAAILLEYGRNYVLQSRLAEAADCYSQSLEIERTRGDELQCARLLKNLGFICRRRGQFAAALPYYEESIALYKKLGRQSNYADVLGNISNVYRLQGKIEEALRRGKIAWRIREELVREGKITEVLFGLSEQALGVIYLDAGDIVQAESHFKRAFDIFLRANDKRGIATVYNHFGQVHINKGELLEALAWLKKSEEASREIDKEQYIISLNKQGHTKALQQHWEESLPLFEQAIAIARQVPAYYQLTESQIELANSYLYLNQPVYVFQHLQEAEEVATRERYLSLLGLIERARGEYYYKIQDYDEAFQHFVQSCHHMALHNTIEFSIAVRLSTDSLMGVPKDVLPIVTRKMLDYWHSHQLEEDYPELVEAFREIDDLMVL
jgi:tetratricopeptide (TPR) repeat protein